MNCEEMLKSIPLYFYGELPPEEEERLEDHLDACEQCRGELERQRALAVAFDRRERAVSAQLLDECRGNLIDAIRAGVAPARISEAVAAPRGPSFSERLSALMAAFWGLRQPVGAVA